MAALIGARLAKYLSEAIDVTHLTFWSDSQIVLYWLSTTKPLKKFVANRVTEIRTLTDICSWRYCPTRDNPADLLTRGISATKFIGNKLWTSGPAWLCNHDKWPIWKTNNFVLQTIIDEQQIPEHHNDKTATSDSDLNMIDFTRYSTYRKLLHVMGYILRYIHNCRHSKNDRNSGPLSVQETKNAEQTLIKICQYTAFQDVIAALHTHKANPLVRQLRLYIDCTGLIRCSGRIHNAPLDFDTKFPVLLPKKHHLTKLIVRDAHARSQHSGGNATTTLLRTKYWIPAIRQVVKSVIRKCVTCRKVSGQPYRAPNVAPLPTIRVTEGPPFSITGVDFTGALYIKQTRESLESKAYICLFTCANTRAIHLEVVSSLSEEVFLLALRRFVSRRSTPNIIISDNATTFQAAATYLRKLFDSTTVRDTLTNLGIQWQFIPKRAPWYGGFWERLIGLTKLALKKVLGKAYINLETLQTIVTEIEATINDRPPTTVSPDMGDPEPLTPAHLLHGRRMTSLPHSNDLTTADVRSSKLDIQNRAKRVTNLLDQYWKRWKTDYLTALREYHQKTGTNQQTISVGDVVLVHDDKARSTWKLATIEKTLPGNDGMIRAAKIRTQNELYTTRPIVKLYPLEVINTMIIGNFVSSD